MGVALDILKRWRRAPEAAPLEAGPPPAAADRSPEHMIAGCEYELRQMRRDMQRVNVRSVPAPVGDKPEIFKLDAGLRTSQRQSPGPGPAVRETSS